MVGWEGVGWVEEDAARVRSGAFSSIRKLLMRRFASSMLLSVSSEARGRFRGSVVFPVL